MKIAPDGKISASACTLVLKAVGNNGPDREIEHGMPCGTGAINNRNKVK